MFADPRSSTPLSKVTTPVAVAGVSAAVSVTAWPRVEGLGEAFNRTVLGAAAESDAGKPTNEHSATQTARVLNDPAL